MTSQTNISSVAKAVQAQAISQEKTKDEKQKIVMLWHLEFMADFFEKSLELAMTSPDTVLLAYDKEKPNTFIHLFAPP